MSWSQLRWEDAGTIVAEATQAWDWTTLLQFSIAYIVVALLLLAYMRVSKPTFGHSKWFVALAVAHNLCLSIWSLQLNVQASMALYEAAHVASWRAMVCTPVDAAFPPAYSVAMRLFLASKVVEFADTYILILRGRSPTLLHVWHHSSVMFGVLGWLRFHVALGMVGMWFNTAVHIFMYAYYALVLMKVHISGKMLITISQIVQFITGFAGLLPFTFLHLASPYGPCQGVPGLTISAFINGSYLVLFILFFRSAYGSKKAQSRIRKSQ